MFRVRSAARTLIIASALALSVVTAAPAFAGTASITPKAPTSVTTQSFHISGSFTNTSGAYSKVCMNSEFHAYLDSNRYYGASDCTGAGTSGTLSHSEATRIALGECEVRTDMIAYNSKGQIIASKNSGWTLYPWQSSCPELDCIASHRKPIGNVISAGGSRVAAKLLGPVVWSGDAVEPATRGGPRRALYTACDGRPATQRLVVRIRGSLSSGSSAPMHRVVSASQTLVP